MSKITCVRFGGYVQLTERDPRTEWRPGHNGIAEITMDPNGILVFRLAAAGESILVYPQPGTIVLREDDDAQPARIAASNPPAQTPARQTRR